MCEKLIIKTKILEYEIASIKSALINEKGHQKWSKVIGFFLKDESG